MFLQVVEGPLWTLAWVVFVVGALWRVVAMLRLGLRRDLAVARGSGLAGAAQGVVLRFFPRRETLRRAPYQVVAGYLFHLGLFALLFFAAPHVKFIEARILGFGWPALPHWAFVVAAQLAFAGLLLLWLRRLLHPVTRLLSSADDHIAAALVFVAMLTGCMALLEGFDALRALHLLTVELLMVYFPFSSLMHTFTFVFARGFTGATYARRHGAGA